MQTPQYTCLELDGGVCRVWTLFQSPETVPDYTMLNENFAYGFAIIFGLWSLGFAVSVAVKLVKLA